MRDRKLYKIIIVFFAFFCAVFIVLPFCSVYAAEDNDFVQLSGFPDYINIAVEISENTDNCAIYTVYHSMNGENEKLIEITFGSMIFEYQRERRWNVETLSYIYIGRGWTDESFRYGNNMITIKNHSEFDLHIDFNAMSTLLNDVEIKINTENMFDGRLAQNILVPAAYSGSYNEINAYLVLNGEPSESDMYILNNGKARFGTFFISLTVVGDSEWGLGSKPDNNTLEDDDIPDISAISEDDIIDVEVDDITANLYWYETEDKINGTFLITNISGIPADVTMYITEDHLYGCIIREDYVGIITGNDEYVYFFTIDKNQIEFGNSETKLLYIWIVTSECNNVPQIFALIVNRVDIAEETVDEDEEYNDFFFENEINMEDNYGEAILRSEEIYEDRLFDTNLIGINTDSFEYST